jgi:hypothetical protein
MTVELLLRVHELRNCSRRLLLRVKIADSLQHASPPIAVEYLPIRAPGETEAKVERNNRPQVLLRQHFD